MSTTTELAELFELAGRLRHTVMALRARHAATPAMRRILLDADRILGDLDLLDADAQMYDAKRRRLLDGRTA